MTDRAVVLGAAGVMAISASFLVLSGVNILKERREKREREKSIWHFFEKVLIGYKQATAELNILINYLTDNLGSIPESQNAASKEQINILRDYLKKIEFFKTLPDVQKTTLGEIAEEVNSIGEYMNSLNSEYHVFGDDGAWGCPMAWSALETLDEYMKGKRVAPNQ